MKIPAAKMLYFATNLSVIAKLFFGTVNMLQPETELPTARQFFFEVANFFLNSWLSGNAFVSGVGGLWFKSRAGQIRHRIANGSLPLQHFF